MPHCKHGRVYQWDVPLDCPECYREKLAQQIAEETAYETLDATHEVAEAQKQMLRTLQQATLAISSTPTSADIELDGAFVGNTPSRFGVPSGRHTLRITKEGYVAWEKKIEISSGTVSVTATLIMTPPGVPTGEPSSCTGPSTAICSTGDAMRSTNGLQGIPENITEIDPAKHEADREWLVLEVRERLAELDQAADKRNRQQQELKKLKNEAPAQDHRVSGATIVAVFASLLLIVIIIAKMLK